eukprot:3842077-Pleurochrysis_carterae.AAC.1
MPPESYAEHAHRLACRGSMHTDEAHIDADAVLRVCCHAQSRAHTRLRALAPALTRPHRRQRIRAPPSSHTLPRAHTSRTPSPPACALRATLRDAFGCSLLLSSLLWRSLCGVRAICAQYVRAALATGVVGVDDIAPRISFFFGISMNM